ncbi:D-alanyl-D-alanine carboxypeptidase family protein [Streptomyces beijiangensis]|uniref:D-alanyl-D-alanine carboxypeptidase n=1 Tax=Streptomyces beijiangensis TaxID=163361 RepID=A0A939FC34_9ACTN|nr:serine hydrolase [Streptomyces beijiangensis]MBO0514707.1 D-alanyl-D-alanine carboxypeptidase [Streptomyces beijiangensis]
MRESSRAPISRRAALGLAAAVPAATAAAFAGSGTAAAATAVGGERLGRDGVQVDLGGAPALPKLSAASWLVADHTTGEVLAAYRAHHRLPPASTLKMLFADTVLPKVGEVTQRHKVTAAELAGIPAGSSLVGVEAGTTYTVDQLWQGVFLRSGNDAVHVLSAMNGGVDETVRQMQAQAVDLQALDTQVVSPDGYDHPGQVSSAYDLTLFARHGLGIDSFRHYCGMRIAKFPDGNKGKTFEIQNTDRLLGTYKGLIGVKNGYTTNAGNTFTGAATRGGRTLLVTVMHPAPGYDMVYRDTSALLDWGFEAAGRAAAVGTLVKPVSEGGALKTAPKPGAAVTDTVSGSRPAASSAVSWPLIGGAGGALALIGGSVFALRNRRRSEPEAAPPEGGGRHRR